MRDQAILQIMFSCKLSVAGTENQAKSEQRKICAECRKRRINGFFLAFEDIWVGLFEGSEKAVLAQIEGLIRKRRIHRVTVVREAELKSPGWTSWYDESQSLEGLGTDFYNKTPGLAQFMINKL